MGRFFVMLVTLVIRGVVAICRSRADLVLENLALRQQVTALKQRRPRPPLDDADRGFWVALRACWSGWSSRLVLVKPDTVVKWHQQRFRRYWTSLSHRERRPGRPRINAEIRHLIRKMAFENGWGAPRIHGELQMLGFVVSETTVSRHMPRKPVSPDQVQRWIIVPPKPPAFHPGVAFGSGTRHRPSCCEDFSNSPSQPRRTDIEEPQAAACRCA